MKVPNLPGGGKDTAESRVAWVAANLKETDGKTSALTDRNYIEAVNEGKTAIQAKA